MPSGDYEMMRQEQERAREYQNSQIAFTSELVEAIRELSKKNLELEGEVSVLKEKLQKILDAELDKTNKEVYANTYRDKQAKLFNDYMSGTGCKCAACNPQVVGMVMILCTKCGNKRCPHATDHTYECTNSNEPGQKGSAY